ncbi:DUF134 domain-containing protein [Candidatus Woesearchaeota archaeon]|nr:DUF134 domain-containing protein [Candidatus Woesearchaeota archaeon]
MPRPFRIRRVGFQPGITYFKPAGIRMIDLEEVILKVDEFEAIRLKDFEGMDQEPAAKKMNISQPTFNRLIRGARKKLADAIVQGKAIRIEGGSYKMVQERPGMGRGRGGRGMGFGGPATTCRCSNCGHEQQKQRGVPCVTLKCTKCGAPMIRGQ